MLLQVAEMCFIEEMLRVDSLELAVPEAAELALLLVAADEGADDNTFPLICTLWPTCSFNCPVSPVS